MSTGPGEEAAAPEFRRRLLSWYDGSRRDLPWRRTSDPYAIWVSEVMLQQTTVATVGPRWQSFLDRFPNVAALASAGEGDVLHAWRGLGYYRRARNMHLAAREVVARHEGAMPLTFAELRKLPGIGDYTAAAVASIAAGERVPVLDANVNRVLARLLACDMPPGSASGRRTLRAEAERLLDPVRPGDFNQAMMELGAAVCTPRGPDCAACPVRDMCRAHARDEVGRYPVLPTRGAKIEVHEVAVVVRRGEQWLWLRRGEEGSFAGMWELPRGAMMPGEKVATAGRRVLRELTGIESTTRDAGVRITHTVMNSRIRLHAAHASPAGEVDPRLASHGGFRWESPGEAAHLPMSSSQHRLLLGLSGLR